MEKALFLGGVVLIAALILRGSIFYVEEILCHYRVAIVLTTVVVLATWADSIKRLLLQFADWLEKR